MNKRPLKPRKLNPSQLQNSIYKFFKKNPKKKYTAKQIIKKLKVKNTKESVQKVLQDLHSKSAIIELKTGDYGYNRTQDESVTKQFSKSSGTRIKGKVDMTRSGDAYIISSDVEDDVFVPGKDLQGAMHQDLVSVDVYRPKNSRRVKGRVTKVLSRATTKWSGEIKVYKKYGIVYVEHPKMHFEVRIPLSKLNNAKTGERVVVEIEEYAKKSSHEHLGKVQRVMDMSNHNDVTMSTILINNGFDMEFPDEVMAEAKILTDKIRPEDLEARRDMRDVFTMTIDPHDAKDFDDALSYQILENGNIEIGIHIADVTHFVKPGTALDKEAYERSTSVYLVDRVCPMLPERLSNELCSLRPNEDKFTFSAVFEFNDKYKIVNQWIGRTLTHSNHRFTYVEAQEVMDGSENPFAEQIISMMKVARKLRKEKFKNGAISFESEEVKFALGEDGKIEKMYIKERIEAHLLIEDFMLLANKAVATFMAKKPKPEFPFVYRIHDLPNQERLEELSVFAAEFGVKLNVDTPKNIAKSFAKLAKEREKNDAIKLLESLAVRTMSKAVYSTDNIGHYGLAFEYYSHFTSPIRRYADVLVHRILAKNLKADNRVKKDKLEVKCQHISARERKAMDAERESIKYKQTEYMADHIGEEYEGIVSGMIEKGIFVELLENKAEGLVEFNSMSESFAVSGRMKAVGNQSGKGYKMGQAVKVRIIATNLSNRTIDMELAE